MKSAISKSGMNAKGLDFEYPKCGNEIPLDAVWVMKRVKPLAIGETLLLMGYIWCVS